MLWLGRKPCPFVSGVNEALSPKNQGSTLIISIVFLTVSAGLAFSALSVMRHHQTDLEMAEMDYRAQDLADAGVHRGIAFVRQSVDLSPFEPFAGLDAAIPLAVDPGDGSEAPSFTLTQDEALIRNGRTFGTFTVKMRRTFVGSNRDVEITATGYVPNAAAPQSKATVQAVVRVPVAPSRVFDYGYFINNWGWFYGNTIHSHGNVRSNGQFDADGYSPTIHSTPRYGDIDGLDLLNPLDGGGVYAGWDIIGQQNIQGTGGDAANQHDFQTAIPMPNLSNLSPYEYRATSESGTIHQGAIGAGGAAVPVTQLADAVTGDSVGEPENLVLVGTPSAPIILDGPVVVRGDVILKGTVTGQGAIYSGGNIYIADDLEYLNPPATSKPASESEADTEAWLMANQGKDFLGLFAGENLVMGDYTNGTWDYYVDWWLSHNMNQSAEDSGTDLIPNTSEGRDGVVGTEDDDVLEGDGQWTVEYYTQAHADLGLIPPGYSVGDAIPGTGEDIDGDGQYDDTLGVSDLALSDPDLSDANKWAGNVPAGVNSYDDMASIKMTHVDAVMYTNHAAALVTLAYGKHFEFFGGLVSRNESIIYGTKTLNLFFDRRLLGGGMEHLLPSTVAPLEIRAWRNLDDGDVGVFHPMF